MSEPVQYMTPIRYIKDDTCIVNIVTRLS